jgi:hypothetical protein
MHALIRCFGAVLGLFLLCPHPAAPASASIYPVVDTGQADYPYYWTGTTHVTWNGMGGNGVYLAFGRALGYIDGAWVDIHGAGAQRSDPKSGDPADYPYGRGPQGDAIRIYNYARLVGDAKTTAGESTAVS